MPADAKPAVKTIVTKSKTKLLIDDFVSVMEYGTENGGTIEEVRGYKTSDGTEIHAGLEYFVLTRWESEEAFQRWRSSDAFRRQHRNTHADEGGGEAKPNHPVAASAELLAFEVVSRTTKP